ncbi:hypothetical protein UA08_03716 [Talaromyces atroroseus]|uniref:Transcription factor domain-containing protein n=1 Tax=Talaromyces atroroseus TaxID=1441469 RepID=A0A225B4T1_TALAT|nr:hypothetical protein UA08_03716 [Talaromyces atroroseus]OKL60937.1 hypothetical protein UA08_03716 [Talaromyces atroroseus]
MSGLQAKWALLSMAELRSYRQALSTASEAYERGSALVEYCLFFFLPSQYHQAADGESTVDLSYLRYMCLESRLLLNAVSACALVTSHNGLADSSGESPHKLYMNAISEISTGIAQGALRGTEDYLLATVLWLCVYEKFQGQKPHEPPASFLGLDVYPLKETDIHENYTIESPVLGAPYNMFLFLVEGIRLVRTLCPGMQSTLEADYACYSDSRRWIGKLYAVAIRLLFLYVISVLEYSNAHISGISSMWYTEMECTLSEARNLLIATEDDVDRTWGKFFLWPLAIIGAMIYDDHGISLVKIWLDRVIRKSNHSSALVIRKVLEEQIWNHENHTSSPETTCEVYTRGLSIVFNTDIMNHTATSLIA